MILGTYRNPPYRSPRPSPSLSPPAAESPGSSPKRKRGDELSISSLRTETASSSVKAGSNSPRTKVAAKLQNLEIGRASPDSSPSPRKRHKRNAGVRRDHFHKRTPPLQREPRTDVPDNAELLEIGETPQMSSLTRDVNFREIPNSSSPPSSPTDLIALRKSFGMTNDGQHSKSSRRLPSQPPPTPRAPLTEKGAFGPSSPVFAPSLPNMEASPRSLTWHDFEITGQELDLTSPDDDGEGINGVGFRPTPAMAWARSQKRKLQIEGWKNREAREARQRRIERRRGGGSGDGGLGGEERRVVRFAEAE